MYAGITSGLTSGLTLIGVGLYPINTVVVGFIAVVVLFEELPSPGKIPPQVTNPKAPAALLPLRREFCYVPNKLRQAWEVKAIIKLLNNNYFS